MEKNNLQPNRTLIVGKSGSGKTTLTARELIPDLRRSFPEIYVFVLEPLPNAGGGWSYPCRERFEDADDLLAYFASDVPPPAVYCVSIPADADDPDIDAFFKFLDRFCRDYKCALVVDELLEYSNAKGGLKGIRYFLRYGRRYGVECIFNSMRPVDVDPMLLTNVREVICFQDHYQRNLDALRRISFIGERADEVARLPKYQYLKFSEGDADIGNKGGGKDEGEVGEVGADGDSDIGVGDGSN